MGIRPSDVLREVTKAELELEHMREVLIEWHNELTTAIDALYIARRCIEQITIESKNAEA